MKLEALHSRYAICKLPPNEKIPAWAAEGEFFNVSRSDVELSILCEEGRVPGGISKVGPWRGLRVAGKLDFSLTGVLASLANPLAAAKVSIFALSTFDTDYIFVRETSWEIAQETLRGAGFEI